MRSIDISKARLAAEMVGFGMVRGVSERRVCHAQTQLLCSAPLAA